LNHFEMSLSRDRPLPAYDTVAIVGVGLIGGSIGKALRERGLARRIVGVGRSQASLDEAIRVGVIDEGTTSLGVGVINADVVVVCTPVSEIAQHVRQAACDAPAGVLVTDAGSTKRIIVESIESTPRAREVFVGAHPIAGSERKGPAYSDADLFQNRVCVITPTAQTPPDRYDRAKSFWERLGCRIVTLTPTEHDEALALTSHLPHVVASALAAAIPENCLPLAGGAYRDGTRVAASDAALWSSIFLANRGPLLDALAQFETEIASFRHALERGDPEAIGAWWGSGRNRRARFDPDMRIQH
jgi:prephenate dehydrogenase